MNEIIKSRTDLMPWQRLYVQGGMGQGMEDVEREIIDASFRTKIKDTPNAVPNIIAALTAGAHIAGYKTEPKDVWMSTCKDLAVSVARHFNGFTIKEIKQAFEYAMIGVLDDYLPLNSQGQPDRKHYNTFGLDYVSRILKAYLGKKNEIIAKIYEQEKTAAPKEPQKKLDIGRDIYNAFLRYKYTGKRPSWPNDHIIDRELSKVGLISHSEPTEQDVRKAYIENVKKSNGGVIGDFVGSCIRHWGKQHPTVIEDAMMIARRREIQEAFDDIINDEVQLTDYLRWTRY